MKQSEAWLVPSMILTALAAAAALLLVPNAMGLLPALYVLPAWMAFAALMACLYGFARAALAGDPAPFASLRRFLNDRRRHALLTSGIMLLAGLNMVSFMWVKTLLNYKVEFWAGPYLARIDYVLFLGHDPWRVLQPLAFPGASLIYLPGWFLLMISGLLMTAAAPPGRDRSAALLSYFALWTVVGPLIHIALPAAGPIFFERRGNGLRFHGIEPLPEVKLVANYLWTIYSQKQFGLASGISAMPSMHVTMATWTLLAFRRFAPHLRALALVGWIAIVLLSMALGWHFACDSIVGTLAAIAAWKVCRYFLPEASAAPQNAPALVRPADHLLDKSLTSA